MNEQILNYINSQRIGVLAVEMPDGSPHGATVHFAHSTEPFSFIVKTHKSYKKVEALTGKASAKASFVIGVNEADMRTLQMDGRVEFGTEDILAPYNEKFPEKEPFDPTESVILVFTPTWWRFTDWTAPKGKQIISSDDK